MEREAIDKIAAMVTEMSAAISEAVVAPAIEATKGYQVQLEVAGFTSFAAERMAEAYHVELIKILFASISAGTQQGKRK